MSDEPLPPHIAGSFANTFAEHINAHIKRCRDAAQPGETLRVYYGHFSDRITVQNIGFINLWIVVVTGYDASGYDRCVLCHMHSFDVTMVYEAEAEAQPEPERIIRGFAALQ